jgi:copper transport protein
MRRVAWWAPSIAVASVIAWLLIAAPTALAHAQLLGTSPQSGSTVAKQPAEVIFEFNQAVGGTLGAVRVYNAQGEEVDNLDVSHPEGHQHWMGVGLKASLPDGTYTGAYRVISADTHIVYGGLIFNIGHAGAAPRFTVAGLIDRNKSGQATEVAFGLVRGIDYVSLALGIGGLVFLLWAWLPALSAAAITVEQASGATTLKSFPPESFPPESSTTGSGASSKPTTAVSDWPAASQAFSRRLWLLLMLAVILGVLASMLGILLQGASAAGVSVWASLKGPIVKDTMNSRFGEIWGSRGIVWLALGLLLVSLRGRMRKGISDPPRALLLVVGAGAAFLAMTPALSGHASVQSPTGVFFPVDAIHVLGASVWIGGIACLLLALPQATRRLEPAQRSRLLMATLARFSPLALLCVIAISATGVVQAYIDVRSFEDLLHSTYGALVIVKVVLLIVLIGLGWVNRERVLPALKQIAAAGGSPGASGVLARRTMRGELALMVVVFGKRSLLGQYQPRPGGARADRRTGARRAEYGPHLSDRREDRLSVHRDQGIDGHGEAPRQGDRAVAGAGQPGRTGPLRAGLGRVEPGRSVAAAHPRPRIGIRRVRKDRVGSHQMIKEAHVKRSVMLVLAVGGLALPAAAQAHVSLHPNTIPAGAFVTLDVRVPGEQEHAYAYKVDMLVPPGFTEIDTQNVPGWSVKEIILKPASPIQTPEGPVDEEVSQIVWTGDRSTLGRLENGSFIQFPLSIAMPSDLAGQSLAFKTVQYYSNGKVIHWIGPPSAEYPAPTVNITAKGGVVEEVAGGEAGPTPGETPAGATGGSASSGSSAVASSSRGASASGGTSKGLVITALILGALGLIAGLGGLLSARRARSAV